MTTYIFCLSFRSTWVRPLCCSCVSGVCVVNVVKLYHVINSVLWCQVPFPRKSDVRFVSTLNSLVGGSFRYLFYLWCVTSSGVQHDFMLSEFLLFYLQACTDVALACYRWRWCIEIKCRSICYRLLNISTESSSTLTSTIN
jgi:hypothetical protein